MNGSPMKWLNTLLAGVILVSASALAPCLLAPRALAQLTPGVDTVRVTLAAGEQLAAPLALTNDGNLPVVLALAPEPGEEPPDDVGEILFGVEFEEYTRVYAFEFAMTDSGRLFVRWDADAGVTEVKELTPELEVVRTFEYVGANYRSEVGGVAWMPPEDAPPGHPEGTLWWLDVIRGDYDPPPCFAGAEAVALVETDLDGVPTGRTVEIPVRPGNADEGGIYCTALPSSLGYDAERELFFHLESPRSELWAVGLDGEVPEGYPVPQTDYDTGELSSAAHGLDASGGTLDVLVRVGAANGWDRLYRIVVADPDGTNTGVETPLMHFAPMSPPQYFNAYSPLRSRLDTSIMVFSVEEGDLGDEPWNAQWLYAVRAAPLPPKWLRVAPVAPELLVLGPEETDEATVKLNAESLEPGTYEGAVAFREDDSGGEVLLRVPVVLTVTPGTDAEDEAAPEAASGLTVYPNPASGQVTVGLTLDKASEVRVEVYDVLGRAVAVLHEGPLGAGEHALSFEAAGLPAGLYLVRVEGEGFRAARRVTVVR